MKRKKHSFNDLVKIMRRLRGSHGCAWDKEQNHASLIPYLFEEAREVKKAIRNNNYSNLQEELGDVFLQILFHSQIASEKGLFTINDVINTLGHKLIRRHPHVFGNIKVNSSADIIKNWHKIKRLEKKQRNHQGNIRLHHSSSS